MMSNRIKLNSNQSQDLELPNQTKLQQILNMLSNLQQVHKTKLIGPSRYQNKIKRRIRNWLQINHRKRLAKLQKLSTRNFKQLI